MRSPDLSRTRNAFRVVPELLFLRETRKDETDRPSESATFAFVIDFADCARSDLTKCAYVRYGIREDATQ